MRKSIFTVLFISALACGFAGCSSSKPETGAPQSTAAEASVSQSTAAETAAAESTAEETAAAAGTETETAAAETEAESEEPFDYADTLFDTDRVHEINIDISEEDWNEILNAPISKPKEYVTATIDGEVYEDVRFSPKGNSSLFMVAANTESDRYSFKLKFNKKDENRTYHGLDSLVLNNSFDDPSYMRDYACAWLFRQQNVPVSLMSFTRLSINGEFYGVYMAAEPAEESFLKRVLDGNGRLYKPESEVLNARDGVYRDGIQEALENDSIEEFLKNASLADLPPDYETPGADLKYTDDDPESYTDITSFNVTDFDDEDVQELISALKNLSLGNYDQAIDEEEVLRYFAVNNFIGNSDGYTSTMLHNYVLYENDGILSMLPWDYNVAMLPKRTVTGGTDKKSWTELINMGLDSPTYQEVSLEDRPMLGWIFKDEAAHAEYETATQEIIDYIKSGDFEKEMQRIHDQIRPYVAEDPTAFCTVEAFDDSYEDVVSFCTLRAESLSKQLNGELAKITAEQNAEDRVPYRK